MASIATPIYKKSTGELVSTYYAATPLVDSQLNSNGYTSEYFTTIKPVAQAPVVPVSTATPPNVTVSQTPVYNGGTQSTPTASIPVAPVYTPPTSNLQPGATGADVLQLQNWLGQQGYLTPAQIATGPGVYGPQTTAAVAKWQKDNGVDTGGYAGYFGPKSQSLYNSLATAGATRSQASTLATSTGPVTTTSTGINPNTGSTLGVNPVTSVNTVGANNLVTGKDTWNTVANSLAVNSASGNNSVTSQLGGIIALLNMPSNFDTQMASLNTQIASLQASAGNEGQDYQDALGQYGATQYLQQLNDLAPQITGLQGQITAFNTESQQGLARITGQSIPQELLFGQAKAYQTQRDSTMAAMAASLASMASLDQAYRNNLTTAENLAQTSVQLKWQGISNQLTLLTNQIDIAQTAMSNEDKKRSDIVTILLNAQKDEVTRQQTIESGIASLSVQAAAGGAPLSVTNAMKAAPDATAAATIGAKYLKGPVESVSSTKSSSGSGSGSVGNEITYALQNGKFPNGTSLGNAAGNDGFVDPNVYLKLYDTYVSANGAGSGAQFTKDYPAKKYINPTDTWIGDLFKQRGIAWTSPAGSSSGGLNYNSF